MYDFPVDYDSIDDDNILDIHEYLMCCTKNHIFFSKYSEMMVFPKKLCWNMIFLVLSGKIIPLFPENIILFFRQEIKDDLSQKNT